MIHESAQTTVSVIVVSWNARKYLIECLASLTAEACRYPMEIIVVDNASSDGSADQVARCYPNVILIRNGENLGFAKANNIGISASKGRYVCFLNSDVKVLTNCITGLVDFCEERPRVGLVGPRIMGGDGKLQRSCRGFPNLWNMFCRALALDTLFPRSKMFTGYSLTYWAQDCQRSVDILFGCFWLVRRAALIQVGLLDEDFFMYGEDLDWCKRFWADRWQVVFVPSSEAIHYGGASSSNCPIRFDIERQKADLQYWKKHHSHLAIATYFMISCLHLSLRATGYSVAALLRRSGRQNCEYKLKMSVLCLKWLIASSLGVKYESRRLRCFRGSEGKQSLSGHD
jgi:GT2 family glycosyltransferase